MKLQQEIRDFFTKTTRTRIDVSEVSQRFRISEEMALGYIQRLDEQGVIDYDESKTWIDIPSSVYRKNRQAQIEQRISQASVLAIVLIVIGGVSFLIQAESWEGFIGPARLVLLITGASILLYNLLRLFRVRKEGGVMDSTSPRKT